MASKREEQGRWPVVGLFLLSLLLHIGLLLMPLPGPMRPALQDHIPTIAVRLFTPPADEGADKAPVPDPVPQSAQLTAVPDSVETLTSADAGEADIAAAPSAARPAPSPSSVQLRAQLLDSARSLGAAAEDANAGTSGALEGAGLPRLPSDLGWLSQYTGTVAPQVDHRQNVDGSSDSRIVTRSGDIVCIHSRAPILSEIFNPWTSTAVPMVRGCGRARPEPLDRSDPWLRQPGRN